MPISNPAFIRSTALLLAAGLATLLGIVIVTYWLSLRTADVASEVTRGRQVRAALVESRSLLQDAETGQRGYLLTKSEDYLGPYEDARTKLSASVAHLSTLLTEPAERGEIDRLRQAIDAKLQELAETVYAMRQGREADALAVVRSGRGKASMDEARALFRHLLEVTDAGIANRMGAQDRAIAGLRWAVIAGAIMIVLVVGGSTVLSLRYTRELISARAELGSLNADLERRVQQRTAELAQANEEVQRFAYVVSHDLRSPLVNIMGFASELEELGGDLFGPGAQAVTPDERLRMATEYDEALGFIRGSVSKMDGLIAAILKLARDGERRLAVERIDLRDLVLKAAGDVQHRLDELGGQLTLDDLPSVVSDRLALDQVFGNLLDNAIKYADPARRLELRVRGRRLGEAVEIDVEDNGVGIAPADQERAFELFRRVGRQDKAGDGMGLAYVQSIVRRLGGQIALRSVVGQGSTFTIRLPAILATLPAA